MLNNTNMGVGDGRPKYLHIVQVKLEKVIILIAFFCKIALLATLLPDGWKGMLRILPLRRSNSCLAAIQVVASAANTDFWLVKSIQE